MAPDWTAALGDDCRSQGHRAAVPGNELCLFHPRWDRSAAHSDSARGAAQYVSGPRQLRRGVYGPRYDHDLSGRDADTPWICELHRAATDRRPRHGISKAERIQLLVIPVRWSGPVLL